MSAPDGIKAPTWLTARSAADALTISERSVYRLCADGALIYAKFRGSVRILSASLRHYQKAQLSQAIAESGIELPADLEKEIENL